MIHVLAFITAKPGRRRDMLEIFRANMAAVRMEEGCIEYNVAVDVAGADPAFGADTFVVIERWASRDALKAHFAASHMKAYAEKVKDLIAGRAVHVLDPA